MFGEKLKTCSGTFECIFLKFKTQNKKEKLLYLN